ncbi:MAG: hypothetical protein UX49_C0010G0007 [Candidatus Wolfebacteria bacterium GW2011_GWC2_46_275]|uniref:Uncharacterized protein n=1 Tax=Candidatus Wolfebacteria bacterium GW2011_GWA2_47_9b TaxID=1619005 RepID=A0A0G1U515_9BACT|nr:MAG: hypothetical protein UX49_C0010G0007 [Candidatus Wolfebacteria bacterium GW2011_GWC2_46_275]KKU76664.1 MAG: hypothetical protein UY00_C0005G0014 [Candidatus Wolfebacteria bacterium GW2011_GWA1_47_6]KKU89161.1 MAG: hypothetical protein UY19_C0018G0006 [Candidatus Wolfebacteria bacterium GW2011_GWA2_47_9b]
MITPPGRSQAKKKRVTTLLSNKKATRWGRFCFCSRLEPIGSSAKIIAVAVDHGAPRFLGAQLLVILEHCLGGDEPVATMRAFALLALGRPRTLRTFGMFVSLHGGGEAYRSENLAPRTGAAKYAKPNIFKTPHRLPPSRADGRPDVLR